MHCREAVFILLTMLAGTAARGQVIVEIDTGGGYGPATGSQATVDGSGNVTLLVGGGVFYRVRTTSPTTQDIGTITYNGTSSITVLITTSGQNLSPSILNEGCRNWAGIGGSGTDHIELQASLHGRITGDVEAEYISRIDCDGGTDANTAITQLGPKSSTAIRAASGVIAGDINYSDVLVDTLGLIEADGISGDITFAAGKIQDIFVQNGGDLTGNIVLTDGVFDTLYVTGDIGTSTSPVDIYAGDDVSGKTGADIYTIKRICCQGDIYANITASGGEAKKGTFGLIIANEGADDEGTIPAGMSDVRRNFSGTIVAYDCLNFVVSSMDHEKLPSIIAADFSGVNSNEGEIRFYNEPLSPIYLDSLSADSMIVIEDRLRMVTPPHWVPKTR